MEACFAAWVQSLDAILQDEARLVDDRSNAITAIPALLETLALDGGIVTLDAMGCQRIWSRTTAFRMRSILALRRGCSALRCIDKLVNVSPTTSPSKHRPV